MAKGGFPKREAKKPKKSDSKRPTVAVPIATSEGIEVVGKKRKRKAE